MAAADSVSTAGVLVVRITVQVTRHKPGYAEVSRKSKPTQRV
jgi:hypothetical protein